MIIEELDLSVRSYNCLKRSGIHTVEQLSEMDDEQLLKVRNISQKCVEEIRAKVSRPGKTNADRIRAMSDEELAEWIVRRTVYSESAWSAPSYLNLLTCRDDTYENALAGSIEWLKSPEKEDA